MRIGKIDIKRRVWIGLAGALVVTGLWWNTALVKPVLPVSTAPAKPPFVRLAASTGTADLILREQAEMKDPTPLFFPTEWNYGQRPLPEGMRRQPGQVFGSFAEKITLGNQPIKPYGSEAAVVPERLVDVVAQSNEAPFAGMGQIDVRRTALPERSGFLEVRDLALGKDIIVQALTNVSMPRTDFAPVEFLAVVSSAGLIGDPVLVSGSGWDEVDNFLRSYLVKSFRLGERLSPGRYRILVGQ